METKNAINTTIKIRTYLESLINDFQKIPDLKEKIDIICLFDNINKTTANFIKQEKTAINFNGKNEVEGNIGRVRHKIREIRVITPIQLQKELDKDTFLKCIKVSLSETEKYLPEKRIKEIAKIEEQEVISIELK